MSDPIRYKFARRYGAGPNCLWEINRPDLGFVGKGPSWSNFCDNVELYRKANGLPIGLNFEQELEWAVCDWYRERGFPDICVTEDPRAPINPRAMTYREVLTGTKVMLSIAQERLAGNNPLVSPEEAEARAAICAGCRFNVPFTKPCGGVCGELKEVVERIVGGSKVSKDDQLNSCYLCGCYLSSAVWVDARLQTDPLPEPVKQKFTTQAPWCWKAKALKGGDSTDSAPIP